MASDDLTELRIILGRFIAECQAEALKADARAEQARGAVERVRERAHADAMREVAQNLKATISDPESQVSKASVALAHSLEDLRRFACREAAARLSQGRVNAAGTILLHFRNNAPSVPAQVSPMESEDECSARTVREEMKRGR